MRFDLKVPFAEKDAAKKLGARWDAANKLWYVVDKADLAPFAKWSPTPRDPGAPSATPAAKPQKAQVTQTEGLLIVGARYVEQAMACACLPWEDCPQCRKA